MVSAEEQLIVWRTQHRPRALHHWDGLRMVGELRIMRLTPVAAFLPYIILAINRLSEGAEGLPIIGSMNIGWPDQAFWQLTLFYYGLVLLSAGYIVYIVRCPEWFRRHRWSGDVLAHDKDMLTRPWQAITARNLAKTPSIRAIAHGPALDEPSRVGNVNMLPDIVQLEWLRLAAIRPKSRIFCSVFYTLGFLLMGIPAFVKFCEVTGVFLQSLGSNTTTHPA